MGLVEEPVRLEMIGKGGTSDDVPLVEEVEELLREVSLACADDLTIGKGSVAVKITVSRLEAGSLVIDWSAEAKMPRRKTKAMTAYVEGGDVVTATHKQEALPMNVEPFSRARGGE